MSSSAFFTVGQGVIRQKWVFIRGLKARTGYGQQQVGW